MSTPARLTAAEWAALAVIILIWGVNNVAAEVATAVLPPLLVGGLRFAIGAVLLAAWLRPPLGELRPLIAVCLFLGPVHYALVYWGFALTEDLSPYVVSLQLWIPFTAVFSWLLLGERMSGPAALGLLVAFAGVAWMTLDRRTIADADAITVGVGASAAIALGTVLARRHRALPPLKMQACVSLFSAATLLPAAFAFEGNALSAMAAATPLVWATVAWAGVVSTVLASGLFLWLVQRREAGQFTPYFLVTPVVSGVLGVVLLGDVVTVQVLIGGLATLSGVALVALAERRRRPPAPPVADPA
jgi:O-acetylserine/cysteine efflux transporter